jgi:tripeptide aminopeptidase
MRIRQTTHFGRAYGKAPKAGTSVPSRQATLTQSMMPHMLMTQSRVAFLLLAASPLFAQTSWFRPSLLEKPDVQKALKSVDDRATAIVEEWIRLVETPAPSGKEQARAAYIKAEMEKLGLTDIRTDDIFNVSGVRKGTGGGPSVVFAAHMDTVFPEGTDLKVKREGDILRAPGIGDDTSNLMATLEMFRALNRGGVKTGGDLIFLASVQEEVGLLGAKHWLESSGYKPDMFVSIDVSSAEVWYGALRIDQFKFFYTSPGAHTLESRGAPSPAKAVAKAISAIYEFHCRPSLRASAHSSYPR